MNIYFIILSVIAGILLSIIYFGGLWYTIKNIEKWRSPWLLITGSYLARSVIVLASFYLLIMNHWSYMVAAFIAFMITRQAIVNKKGKISNAIYG
jgi:F1F0 ATPase subunit 2